MCYKILEVGSNDVHNKVYERLLKKTNIMTNEYCTVDQKSSFNSYFVQEYFKGSMCYFFFFCSHRLQKILFYKILY